MKIYCNNVCNKNMHKFKKYEQEANQLVGHAKCCTTKIRPKAVRSGIFGGFLNFDKCRSEVTGDIMSGVAVHYVSMDVRSTFGEMG